MAVPSQGIVALSALQVLAESDRLASNNTQPGYTTLTAAITSSGATSISVAAPVANPNGFPSSGNYYIMVDSEQMQVTAGWNTATWTVTRGTNGTTPATHLVNTYVFQCATTLIPIMPVFFDPMIDRYYPNLMRDSYESFYETIIVAEHSEIKGIKIPATFEVLTNLLSWAVGAGTPTTTGQSTSWAFNPNLTADNLQGVGAEFFTDTAAYHIAGSYAQQFVLDVVRGKDSAQMTIDLVGQQAFQMGHQTPALSTPISPSDTELNLLNPAYSKSYLDTTTIGTTLSNDLESYKLTVVNGIQQLYFLNGILSPTAIARPTRTAALEVVQWFDTSTELANYMNTVGNGVKRKIRLLTTGPNIGTSGTANSLQTDWYGYWKTAPFKVDKDVWALTLTGDSVYQTGVGNSWSMLLVNGLAAEA